MNSACRPFRYTCDQINHPKAKTEKSVSRIEVNGKATNIHPVDGGFEMRGQARDGTPLRWTVLRG